MKRHIFIAVVGAVLMASCQSKGNIEVPVDPKVPEVSEGGFTLIGYSDAQTKASLGAADAQTKTSLGASDIQTKTDFGTPDATSIPFVWSVGDKITLKDGTESEALTEGGARGTFTFNSGSVAPGDSVFYNKAAQGTAGYSVKNVQNGNLGDGGDYGVGVIADDGVCFTLQHKTSYMWLNPKAVVELGSKVVRVDIESDGNIAGNGTSNYKNITVNIPDDKELRIGTSAANGIWLAVVIAPTTITKFSIIYHFEDGTKAICNFERELNFEPGKTRRISHTISDIIRTLTFESGSEGGDFHNQIGDSSYDFWNSLIDSNQYGGSLLYGPEGNGVSVAHNPYNWKDQGNTELQHMICEQYGVYSYDFGGHAISHYNSSYIPNCGNSLNQLTVYNGNASQFELTHTTGGGHNGSENFAVHTILYDPTNYYGIEDISLPTLIFGDSNARVIDHMYVNNTTYVLNSLLNGNDFSPRSAQEGDYLKIVATGYDVDNNTTTAEFYLCNGRDGIITEWTKWDLSSLGSVTKVTFNIVGSITNENGVLTTPPYFAYDDLAVRFPL